jgi:hypothetical protein
MALIRPASSKTLENPMPCKKLTSTPATYGVSRDIYIKGGILTKLGRVRRSRHESPRKINFFESVAEK